MQSSSSVSTGYNQLLHIAQDVENSLWGQYDHAEKLLGDQNLPRALCLSIKDSLVSTRSSQEVAAIIRIKIAKYFFDEKLLKEATQQLNMHARKMQFSNFARRQVRGLGVFAKEQVITTEFFKGHPLTCYNFTGYKMIVSSGRGRYLKTQIHFPELKITLDYLSPIECIAFLSAERSKHSSQKDKMQIEVLELEEGQYTVKHLFLFDRNNLRLPNLRDVCEHWLYSDTDYRSPILGLSQGIAEEVLKGMEYYKDENLQIVRFKLPTEFDLANHSNHIFSYPIARHLRATKNVELVVWRRNNEPCLHHLEKSYPSNQLGNTSLFHFLHSERNTSLKQWQFSSPPEAGSFQAAQHKLDLDRSKKAAEFHGNRTPYQDVASYSIVFGQERAKIGKTQQILAHFNTAIQEVVTPPTQVMDEPNPKVGIFSRVKGLVNGLFTQGSTKRGVGTKRKRGEENAPELKALRDSSFAVPSITHTLNLVKDKKERLDIAFKIFRGELPIQSVGLNSEDDTEPAVLFDTSTLNNLAPMLIRFTQPMLTTFVEPNSPVGVHVSVFTARIRSSGDTSASLDQMRQIYKVYLHNVQGQSKCLHNFSELFPYGRSTGGLASAETESGEIIYGSRLLSRCRVTPFSSFGLPIIEILKTIHDVFKCNIHIPRYVVDFLTENEEYTEKEEPTPCGDLFPSDDFLQAFIRKTCHR